MSPNDQRFQLRTTKEFLTALDNWRRHQPDIPGRSEAIRRLVEYALHEQAAATDGHELGAKAKRK